MVEREDWRAAPAKRTRRRGFRRRSSALMAAAAAVCWCAAPGLAQNQPAQNEAGDNGEKIFMQNNCFVCHGQQGFGGIGPTFRNDPFLQLNDHVVGQILMGRGVMPPFADRLDDGQVAAVATYIRNSWGNRLGSIHAAQVAQIRRDLDAFKRQAAQPSSPTTGSAPLRP